MGIDPGIGLCGVATVVKSGGGVKIGRVAVIKTTIGMDHAFRLCELRESLVEILESEKPESAVVEKLIFAKNVTTAMAVAEARGVILQVLHEFGVRIVEVLPNVIKNAVTGDGNAKKGQVTRAILSHFGISNSKLIQDDAADALAMAWWGAVSMV